MQKESASLRSLSLENGSINKISFLRKKSRKKELFYSLEVETSLEKKLFCSENFVFVLRPENELRLFSNRLEKFLHLKKNSSFYFQPMEASFEFKLEAVDSSFEEFRAFFWIDLGELLWNYNSWDALGFRFVTSRSAVFTLAEELLLFSTTYY